MMSILSVLYPAGGAQILSDDYQLVALSDDELTQDERLTYDRLCVVVAKGTVDLCILWKETSVSHDYVDSCDLVTDMRRVAIVTHDSDGQNVSVVHDLTTN